MHGWGLGWVSAVADLLREVLLYVIDPAYLLLAFMLAPPSGQVPELKDRWWPVFLPSLYDAYVQFRTDAALENS